MRAVIAASTLALIAAMPALAQGPASYSDFGPFNVALAAGGDSYVRQLSDDQTPRGAWTISGWVEATSAGGVIGGIGQLDADSGAAGVLSPGACTGTGRGGI